MSAVNPLPASDSSSTATEKRSYEPSMEEILASIRRIIADDQSLPKHPTIDPVAALTAAEPPPVPAAATPGLEPAPLPELRPGVAPAESALSNLDIAPAPSDMPQAAPAADEELERTPAPAAHDPLSAYEPVSTPLFPAPHGPVGDEGGVAAAEEPARVPELHPASVSLDEIEPAAPPPSSVHELHPSSAASAASIARDETLYETPIEPPRHRRPQPQLFSEETDSSVSSAFNLLAASRLADNSDELLTLAREMIKPLLRTWLDDNLPSMVERMVRAEIERVARGGR